jgi:predicted transcriptional regulator
MLPELSEIKARRKIQGLTQSGLAALSGVSQSLIAKLEAGKIVPSYDKAKKLFDTLEKMHEESGLCAGDVMVKKVLFVSEDDSIKKAVAMLEKKALSQLPVLRKSQSVGLVTEKGILAKLGSGIDVERGRVKDAMEEAAPTIQETTPLQIVSQLLTYSPAVLVKKKGKIRGIITKSDLLKTMVR